MMIFAIITPVCDYGNTNNGNSSFFAASLWLNAATVSEIAFQVQELLMLVGVDFSWWHPSDI